MQDVCGKSAPFSCRQIPPQLAQLGVSEDEWESAIKRLGADVQSLKHCACNAESCVGNCLGLLSLCLLLPVLCAMAKKNNMVWDAAFRAWQANFNEKVLVPKGAFCKSQLMAWLIERGGNNKQRFIACWVAFALQPQAVAHLKAEPHLFGDTKNFSGCNGVNELDCCMHPLSQ
jgi:hypothetical protein